MRSLLGALSIALLLGAAGCATTAPSAPPTSSPPYAAACPAQVVLTEASTGDFCVTRGGTVTVTLHGAPGQPWQPIQARGEALTVTSVPPSPVVDAVTASYVAAQAGMARITSSRPACPPPTPGAVACHAVQAFAVAIMVS